MSTTKTAEPRIYWAVVSGLTLPTTSDSGQVLLRGQWLEIDDATYERTKGRDGLSWLDMSDDDQLERWGEIRFAKGKPPTGIGIGSDDELARFDQRRAREDNLKFISDPDARRAERDAIVREYGRPTTQRTVQR